MLAEPGGESPTISNGRRESDAVLGDAYVRDATQ